MEKTIKSRAAIIWAEPVMLQVLCDLYSLETDLEGWISTSSISRLCDKYHAKGIRSTNVMAIIEKLADEFRLLEWGGRNNPKVYRKTNAFNQTLDDLKHLKGDQFRDPRPQMAMSQASAAAQWAPPPQPEPEESGEDAPEDDGNGLTVEDLDAAQNVEGAPPPPKPSSKKKTRTFRKQE